MRSAWGSGSGLRDLEQRRADLVGPLVRTACGLAAEAGGPCASRPSGRSRTPSRPPPWTPTSPRRSARDGSRSRAATRVSSPPDSRWRRRTAGNARSRNQNRTPGASSRGDSTQESPCQEDRGQQDRNRQDHGQGAATEKTRAKGTEETERPTKNVTRTSAARARRAETLRKRADEAERKLTERVERADAAQREVDEASAEVGRLRHELDRAVAARDAASRRAERAEQNRARAEEAAREAARRPRRPAAPPTATPATADRSGSAGRPRAWGVGSLPTMTGPGSGGYWSVPIPGGLGVPLHKGRGGSKGMFGMK